MDIPAAFTALAEATWRRRGAARLEFFSLAGLLVMVLAELAFGKLGMEVLEGDTSEFDRAFCWPFAMVGLLVASGSLRSTG